MAVVNMTKQACECVLNEDGKLIERVGGCQVDHVDEDDDTSGDTIVAEMTLENAVKQIEHEVARLDKMDSYKRKRKAKELFVHTRALLINCANGLVQLGNTIEMMSGEAASLRKTIAQLEGETKRIIMP